MKRNNWLYVSLLGVLLFSCHRTEKKTKVTETRTAGETTILVDESFSRILDQQIQVFTSDYPEAKVHTLPGNEARIIPELYKGKLGMIVLSRLLSPSEERYFKQKQIPVVADRFAIDGIALITHQQSTDTTITVQEVFDILKGKGEGKRRLVFDNAASSTVRYFLESAGVKQLPSSGVYTLNTSNDVIKYVAESKDYFTIGLVGVNWLMANSSEMQGYLSDVKAMGVKDLPGKKGDDAFYKPTQNNLINGVYPFLRNIYIINCEGKNGLGTGFANWLSSPRGQLIVLKSGLGPHKMVSREFNLK